MNESAGESTTTEPTEGRYPQDLRVGHDYVSRARPGEPWNRDWCRVVDVRWVAREGAYRIKVEQPVSWGNHPDHFHIRPTARVRTRPSTTREGRAETATTNQENQP